MYLVSGSVKSVVLEPACRHTFKALPDAHKLLAGMLLASKIRTASAVLVAFWSVLPFSERSNFPRFSIKHTAAIHFYCICKFSGFVVC